MKSNYSYSADGFNERTNYILNGNDKSKLERYEKNNSTFNEESTGINRKECHQQKFLTNKDDINNEEVYKKQDTFGESIGRLNNTMSTLDKNTNMASNKLSNTNINTVNKDMGRTIGIIRNNSFKNNSISSATSSFNPTKPMSNSINRNMFKK